MTYHPGARAIHETRRDLANEAEIVRAIRKATGYYFVKLPVMYHVEGVLFRSPSLRGSPPRDPAAMLQTDERPEFRDIAITDLVLNPGFDGAILEAKHRECKPDRYPTIILSLAKFLRGTEVAGFLRVPFFFAVRFEDRSIHVAEMQRGGNSYVISFSGRSIDRDGQDRELVVEVPLYQFTSLEQWAAREESLP
jgi:hypothetical protein